MKQGNFVYMLIGLLVFLLLAPAITQYFPTGSTIIIQLAFMSVMVIGVWSFEGDTKWFIAGISLAILGVILSITNFFFESRVIFLTSLANILAFCVLSAVDAMKQILFSGRITTNKLIGSVCIYLLLGLIWGLIYIFIAEVSPDAFKGLTLSSDLSSTWEYIYYSFVTLTTLGYGDISPVNAYARVLAYLEAIAGQLYIAILVASLVGAHIVDQQNNK